MFSNDERNRRLQNINAVMEKEGLSAIYLPGNSVVGTNDYGNYRYITDSKVIFYLMNVVIPKGKEPIGISANSLSNLLLKEKSFVRDSVIDADQLHGVISLLEENCPENTRVGTLMDVLPAGWLDRIQTALPTLEFMDIADSLFEIRTKKSKEEIEAQKICGRIADEAYRAICSILKPGVYESEIIAEMDYAMQRLGADESFSLITSGQFDFKEGKLPPLHNCAAQNRKLQYGDVVGMEITPRYMGYWTQLVRTMCIGEKNQDVECSSRIGNAAIEEAVKIMKPGVTIGELYNVIYDSVQKTGYKPTQPFGHIAAIDLNEQRITPNNPICLEEGMMVILHPTVITESIDTGIYWGESYLVTETGCESLVTASKDVFVSLG